MSKQLVEKILKERNQTKLLRLSSNFSDLEFDKLLDQLKIIPWDEYLPKNLAHDETAPTFSPSKIISLKDRSKQKSELKDIGLEAYKKGEVAVVMVAGGQGTRLGFPGPKGCYKIGSVSEKSLYQVHSEKVLATSLKFGQRIPFLIMTSSVTDAETRNFFQNNNRFGLAEDQLEFFQQASIPSFDLEGNLLLSGPGELLSSPDGHGGCFTALAKSGLLGRVKNQGVKHLVYIQVDNVLAPVFDPFLIGLAISEGVEVVTKVVEKNKAEEKVGILVSVNGNDTIKEYIDLPQSLLEEKAPDGKLRYSAGNTAMHYWSIDFLDNKYQHGYKLPLHASKKPLTTWENGETKEVDGFKYERFIFDLIPEARSSIGLEVDRCCEFAPLKNNSGSDSPETVHQLSSNLYRNWLTESGISLSSQVSVELSPLFAMNAETVSQTLSFDKKLREQLISKSENKEKIYIE